MAAEAAIDIEAWIEENARARAELMVALDSVPESARDEVWAGEWMLSDIVAHLAGAQEGYAEALEHIARGEPPAIEGWEPGPPDDWNAATVAARRDRTWEQRLADLDVARERHEAAVRAISAGTYGAAHEGFPHQFSRARNPAEHYAANTARHERFHIHDIVEHRRERGL